MVTRNFVAFDSESLVVTSSSNGTLVNNPIVNNSDTPDGTVFQYSAGSGVDISLDDDGGSSNVFNDDQEDDHVIIDGGGIVANGQEVEAESLIRVRALDTNGDPVGPLITITVFSQNGQFFNVWGFSTNIPLQDGVSYVKISGSNTGSSLYTSFVACFCNGTLIRTAAGRTAVEQLNVGDLVWTRDAGAQPVRWLGHTSVVASSRFAPIVFDAMAIGNCMPLAVSPEHRMLLSGPNVSLLFGTEEVLVAAKYLLGLPGVHQRKGGIVDYHHLMLDAHQIVEGNGCLSESFFASKASMSTMAAQEQASLFARFPELAVDVATYGATAAQTLKAHEANVLVAHWSMPETLARAA